MAKKRRSPRYPIIGLKDAIERLRALYEREGKAKVMREVAVKAWGYTAISGPASQLISTLSQYGLIDKIGGKSIKIAELGLDILLPTSPQVREEAMKRCALRPSIFTELLAQYPDGLPSDDALRAVLIRRKPPYYEDSARKIITALRETLDFSNLGQNGYVGIDNETITENDTGSEAMIQQETSSISVSAPPKPLSGTTWSFPITGRTATLNIPGADPKQEEIDLIINILNAYKPSLEKNE